MPVKTKGKAKKTEKVEQGRVKVLGQYTAPVKGRDPELVLVVDGGTRGRNPGPGYWSFAVLDAEGKRAFLSRTVDYPLPITSNQAEYLALIEGLKALRRLGWQDLPLLVATDSRLLQGQLGKGWQVKSERLAGLHQEARELLRQFAAWRVFWIPREQVVWYLGH